MTKCVQSKCTVVQVDEVTKNMPIASVVGLDLGVDEQFPFVGYFSTLKYASSADTNFQEWTDASFTDENSLDGFVDMMI